MSGKTALYKTVLRQYEQIRWKKEQEWKQRRQEIYTACPRLQEIDQEIGMAGIHIAKMVLETPENRQILMTKLKQCHVQLQQEKSALLEELGFSSKALELEYVCKDCKDTGYIGDTQCPCMKQKLMDAAYQQSTIQAILKEENFDTFDIRYYSTDVISEEGISPQDNMKKIFRACLDFCSHFDTTYNNLLFYGSTGLGKTFLCNCIAKELLDQGKTVLYVTAGQLFRIIEKQRFHAEEEEPQQDTMEDLLSVDLLLIDDLGTEFSTILSSAELFRIINTRMLTKKPIVVSTNLAPNDLIEQYSDRVVSRLLGSYISMRFFGDDIRIRKKFKT